MRSFYLTQIIFVFNSPGAAEAARREGESRREKSVGLRVNPECSTQEGHAIYDPCAPGSVWER